MVTKLSGYFLMEVGLLGFLYFKNYKGETIPLPILWLILSLVIVLIGVYLIVSAKMKRQVQKLNENEIKNLQIKENGQRILIDFDNCEFKSSTTSQLNQETFSRAQMIDALYDPNRNHIENWCWI